MAGDSHCPTYFFTRAACSWAVAVTCVAEQATTLLNGGCHPYVGLYHPLESFHNDIVVEADDELAAILLLAQNQ
ncbi:MAG: hypothetical protein R3E79_61480 [Caldilineaceae bacterium]